MNKKTLKKLLVVALAFVMVFAMAACGSDESAGDGDGAAEAKFVIGGIGPVTGAVAIYGQAVKNGAELAMNEINAAGGINGTQIEFIWGDDEGDGEKAVNAYNSLKDDGMQILMGTVTSGACVAVVAETAADHMFQLTPSGSAVDCVNGDNAYRICFSDPNQGIGAADYMADNFADSKIAVIYDSSDVYSNGIFEKFNAQAKARGLNIVTAQAFTKDSKTDFTVQLQKIKESGADLVFIPIYYQEAALILNQAQGMDVKFFGCDGLDGVIPQLGDDAALAEGVMLLTPFAADAADEKTQTFTAAYKTAYNDETPNQFAADAYDAMYTIKAAIEKAGATPDMEVSALCDAIVGAMTQITVDGVTGEMTWSADGEPTKSPKAMIIKDGAYSAL